MTAELPCPHSRTVTQHMGDGTPIEFCPDCGKNVSIGKTPERTQAEDEGLPPLPMPMIRVDEYVTGFTADQLRAYAREAVALEWSRIIEEIERIKSNDRACNLTAGELVRNEIADDLIAAIRED